MLTKAGLRETAATFGEILLERTGSDPRSVSESGRARSVAWPDSTSGGSIRGGGTARQRVPLCVEQVDRLAVGKSLEGRFHLGAITDDQNGHRLGGDVCLGNPSDVAVRDGLDLRLIG